MISNSKYITPKGTPGETTIRNRRDRGADASKNEPPERGRLMPNEFRAAGLTFDVGDSDVVISNRIGFEKFKSRPGLVASQTQGKRGDEDITKEFQHLLQTGKILLPDQDGVPRVVDLDNPPANLPSLQLLDAKGNFELAFMKLLPSELWTPITNHGGAMQARDTSISSIASITDSISLLQEELDDAEAELSKASEKTDQHKQEQVVLKLRGAIERAKRNLKKETKALPKLQQDVMKSQAQVIDLLRNKFAGSFVHGAATPPTNAVRDFIVNHGVALGAWCGMVGYSSVGFARMALADHEGLSPEDAAIVRTIAAVAAVGTFAGATLGCYLYDRSANRPPPGPHGFV